MLSTFHNSKLGRLLLVLLMNLFHLQLKQLPLWCEMIQIGHNKGSPMTQHGLQRYSFLEKEVSTIGATSFEHFLFAGETISSHRLLVQVLFPTVGKKVCLVSFREALFKQDSTSSPL
jgi:hypothetical protein